MSSRHIFSRDTFGTGQPWSGYAQYQKDIEGGNTPRELRTKGLFTENGLSSWTELLFNQGIEISFSGPSGPWSESSMFSVGLRPIPEDSVSLPDVYDDLLPKLASAFRESDFNVGVFAAEGKESIRMMSSRLVGLARSARSLRKGNLGGALRELTGQVPRGARRRAQQRLDSGDVSGAFLEAHLGWVPMYKDLYSAAGLLNLVPRQNVITATAVHKTGIRAAGQPSEEVISKGSYVRMLRAKCIVTREPSLIERLGLTDPFGVIWEAVPFSFVVDYVSPIGRSLESMHAVSLLPIQKLVLTQYDRMEGSVMPANRDFMGGAMWMRGVYLPALARSYHVERGIYGSIHDVISGWSFMPKNLVPKWDKGLKQLGILSALAHQALKDLGKGRR